MFKTTIKSIDALEILDSRGNPTIGVQVKLNNNITATACAPSGASTGSREALELRDHDAKRYFGKGVTKAVALIKGSIANAILGMNPEDQTAIDQKLLTLDGTENKEKLGANSILSVSLAVAKAAARSKNMSLYQHLSPQKKYSLPVPMMNIINGGAHADNNLDIQEFMILPVGATSFPESVRCGVEIFHTLKKVLHEKKLATSVGDEGGFAPDLQSNAQALEIILQAIEQAGYKPGKDVCLGLDVASNELFENGQYILRAENKALSAQGFADYLADLVGRYPIISIEDGMQENDWEGWAILTQKLGKQIQLVGDDLFVTNTRILQRGITEKVANAILIKPNQIGTLTETLAAITMAKMANYNTIISHRSGETEDTTIADIAVGTQAGQIKTGSLCRSDRVAKYNRLLQINQELGSAAVFAGAEVFAQFQCFKQLEIAH